MDNSLVEVEIKTPHAKENQTPECQAQIDTLGLSLFNLLQMFAHIKEELKRPSSNKKYVLFQIIKQSISSLSTTDPNSVHYEIARELLRQKAPDLLDEVNCVDNFARELCSHFKILNTKLQLPKNLKKVLKGVQTSLNKVLQRNGTYCSPSLDILELPDYINEKTLLMKKNLFLWDSIFIEHLETIGKEGKKCAQQLRKKLESTDNIESNKNFWFNSANQSGHVFLSKAFLLLAYVLFEEKIKRLANLSKTGVSALTTHVHKGIVAILSPRNKVVNREEKEINLFNKDEQIGSLSIPVISPKVFSTVFNGAKKLNTVTGHRIIRLFPQTAFNSMLSGEPDYRVIHYERGATEVAEKIGAKGNRIGKTITEILHPMAYMQFPFENHTGNLIQLSKEVSSITHRKEAYTVTVGTLLLPYHTFEDGGFLIPLINEPPFIGSPDSYARQLLLQMRLMGIFSNQSLNLSQQGFIEINEDTWQKLALSCDIKEDLLKKIKDRWTQYGTDGSKFLDRIDNNLYTLGKEYKKELNFLKYQGSLKKRRSDMGKASANKKALFKRIKGG